MKTRAGFELFLFEMTRFSSSIVPRRAGFPRAGRAFARAAGFVALLLSLSCAACAPFPVKNEASGSGAEAGSDTALKTFRWAPEPATRGTTKGMGGWRSEIRRAIERELAGRGYRKGRGAGAEIAFRMVFTDGSAASVGDFSKRRAPARGEGGFTIEAREPGSDEIIWRAVVAAPLAPVSKPRDSREALESLVGAMLKALPPVL